MEANIPQPKVSVFILAYKHGKYISKCLDSVLNQKVNFNYEVIVGDDCSNDGTKEVLNEYARMYPDVLNIIINEENLGAARNLYNIMNKCNGEYISGIEGDDFWCDLNKLQKQVDYLDSHKEIMAVGSNYYSINEAGDKGVIVLSPSEVGKEYCLNDYFKAGMMVIHGNTVMYRNIIPKSGEKYEKVKFCAPTMSDVFLRCLIYDSGNIYVMNEPTLCHRDGLNVKSSFSSRQIDGALHYSEMYMTIVKEMNIYFGGKYDFTDLFCNRMSALFIDRLLRHINFKWSDYWRVLCYAPLKYRIKVPLKIVKIMYTKVKRKIYRKTNRNAIYYG